MWEKGLQQMKLFFLYVYPLNHCLSCNLLEKKILAEMPELQIYIFVVVMLAVLLIKDWNNNLKCEFFYHLSVEKVKK